MPLGYVRDGRRYAPLLALVLRKRADERAVWMVAEQGESLNALDENETPVRKHATEAQLAMIARRMEGK